MEARKTQPREPNTPAIINPAKQKQPNKPADRKHLQHKGKIRLPTEHPLTKPALDPATLLHPTNTALKDS